MTTTITITESDGRYSCMAKTSLAHISLDLEEHELTEHVQIIVQKVQDLTRTEAEEVLAEKDAIIEQKEQEVLRAEQLMQTARTLVEQTATDEQLLEVADIFDAWEDWIGKTLSSGKILRHGENLYRVRQEHLVQEHFPPSIDTASLYLMIVPPGQEDEIMAWEDRHSMGKELYKLGDKVTHTGFYWTSKVNSNHWEPTEENWAAWEKGEPV